MIDIVSVGSDIGVYDTQTARAGNILSVQFGALEYAQDLGIDLAFFLSDEFRFQNAAFKSYLIEVLANRGIDVSTVVETINTLYTRLTFNLTSEKTSTGLIAR